jgi:hypothetical protein
MPWPAFFFASVWCASCASCVIFFLSPLVSSLPPHIDNSRLRFIPWLRPFFFLAPCFSLAPLSQSLNYTWGAARKMSVLLSLYVCLFFSALHPPPNKHTDKRRRKRNARYCRVYWYYLVFSLSALIALSSLLWSSFFSVFFPPPSILQLLSFLPQLLSAS